MRRGYLIQTLMLLALLFVFCLAILGRQPYAYSTALQNSRLAQARALAMAGLEDIRVKLVKDYEWRRLGQVSAVSYVEDVLDPETNARLGSYRVTLNQEWAPLDYEILRIECEGILGNLDRPEARLVISTMMDIRVESRTGGGDNPDFFRLIEWNERVP